jgi:hypothetical protein
LFSRVAHIGLSALIFISASGFVLNEHYCQNTLKSKALFVKAESCKHQDAVKPCSIHGTMPLDQKDDPDNDCCKDKSEFLKNDEQFTSKITDTELLQKFLSANVLCVILHIDLPSIDKQTLHYLNYKPPLIVCDDMPVSLQTFLC